MTGLGNHASGSGSPNTQERDSEEEPRVFMQEAGDTWWQKEQQHLPGAVIAIQGSRILPSAARRGGSALSGEPELEEGSYIFGS